MTRYILLQWGLFSLILVGLLNSNASASVQIDITTFATGVDKGTATVATLVITQNGANVDFVLTNLVDNLPGNSTSAFISTIGFCYQGTTKLKSSSFTNFAGTQAIAASSFTVGMSNLPGGYKFPLKLSFPQANKNGGIHRFKHGETVTWTILNVKESDFTGALVLGTGEDALAAAHIQALENDGSTTYTGVTTTTVVPEASGLLIWSGLALVGLFGSRHALGRSAVSVG